MEEKLGNSLNWNKEIISSVTKSNLWDSHQVPELPKEFLVGCFISGLRDTIKYDIIAKNPVTMMEAMRLAQVEEEKSLNQWRGCKFFVQKGSNAPPSTWSGSGMKNHTSNPTTHSTVRRLSPQELREKRYKSLCFYCDGKYRAGHKCKNQKIL